MASEEPDDAEAAEADRSAPLGDLAERVRERRSGTDEGDVEEGFGLEEYFQEEGFESVASDDLWESLEAESPFEDGVEGGEEPDEHIVPKRSYCEGCEYFSAPPEVHCTHPGTSILEFVDIDHVRVRNCPVVEERQALGGTESAPMTPGTFGDQ